MCIILMRRIPKIKIMGLKDTYKKLTRYLSNSPLPSCCLRRPELKLTHLSVRNVLINLILAAVTVAFDDCIFLIKNCLLLLKHRFMLYECGSRMFLRTPSCLFLQFSIFNFFQENIVEFHHFLSLIFQQF